MSVESQILVSNYGIPEDFAERLLDFTGKDIEGAIRLIESSDRDIAVVKAKFISNKRLQNGGLILFFNFQTNLPEYIFCAISSDGGLSKIKLDASWREFIESMNHFLGTTASDPELASKIENQVFTQENVGYINTFFADRNKVDLTNLKRFLLSEISKVLLDTGVLLKIATDTLDIFKLRLFENSTRSGLKIIAKNLSNSLVLIHLQVEPILSPLGGRDIEIIQPGDIVLVHIVDTRDIVAHLKELIPADESYRSSGVFPGKVITNNKSQESGNCFLAVEFGPGILGTIVLGGKVKIQALDNPNQQKVQPQSEKKDNTFVISREAQDFPEANLDNSLQQSLMADERDRKSNRVMVGIMVLMGLFLVMFILITIFYH